MNTTHSNYYFPDLLYFRSGIDGVKIKIFSTSMDAPGRAELLGMSGHSSYTACCVCRHCFSAAIPPATQCLFDGYRRWLHPRSRGRQTRVQYKRQIYQYATVETRAKPPLRDNNFVRTAVAFAKQRGLPYLGHKNLPLLSRWCGFDWYRMNAPDFMHDMKAACDMFLKLIVGRGVGVHDEGSEGGYRNWNKDVTHRREAQHKGIFRDIWTNPNGRLPWRLTQDEVRLLDRRTASTLWPHYVDRLHYEGCSFWIKPGRLWKTCRKIVLLLFLLCSQLRDMIPAMREALNSFVWALRRLDGQAVSYDEAKRLGILPGSRALKKSSIKGIHRDLVRGLCLLNGCGPESHLKPNLHHFVHYGRYGSTHGLFLRDLSMVVFERYNKYMKGLVRDVSHPEANLANSVTQDAAAHFSTLSDFKFDIATAPHHTCVLSSKSKKDYVPSANVLADLRMMNVAVDCFSCCPYDIAHIMGVHFRAGEWGKSPRCGSVITCVLELDGNRRSVYGRVEVFLTIEGDDCPGYAVVSWFCLPEYPSGTPLVVRVRSDDGSYIEDRVGSVIKITTIDPSRVMVETGTDFYMMRDSGFDTICLDI